MSPEEQHELLVRGLVGDAWREYHNDAEFHATVETLARIAPAVVETLAEKARESMKSREAALLGRPRGGQ